MKNKLIIALTTISILFVSCIKNDIPYPRVVSEISEFQVRGQISSKIDPATRTVKIELADTVDIQNVRLMKMEVTNEAAISPEPALTIDLSSPKEYILTTYQDYKWTISATQVIDRYFEVENQIGDPIIDVNNKKIIFSIPDAYSLSNLKIKRAKLGPTGSTIFPNISTVTNFSQEVELVNIFNGKADTWKIYGTTTKVTFSTGNVNAYAKYALVSGSGESNKKDYTFEYKKSDQEQWQSVASSGITFSNGSFTTTIEGLTPNTQYQVRVADGDSKAKEVNFTTEQTSYLPNMNFDEWTKGGKHWYVNNTSDKTNSNYIWDSGNIGANTLSEVNPTSPTTTVAVPGEGKQAARLESKAVFGILAAGNVYTGQFGKTIGTSGAEIYFGRPFTSRPKSFKGYYNYVPVSINKAGNAYKDLMGKPDIFSIYIVLAKWDNWFTVNTSEGKFINFDDPSIIAYEYIEGNENTNGFKEFNLDIKYRNNEKPTHCLIVASASKYGDFFTGGVGSVLIVDEFDFQY